MSTTMSAAPIELARELDGLHQLLYTRRGHSSLQRCGRGTHKAAPVEDRGRARARRRRAGLWKPRRRHRPRPVKTRRQHPTSQSSVRVANSLPSLSALLPSGKAQPVWPLDEPLRIARPDVLSEAVRILGGIELGAVGASDPVGTAFDVFLRGKYEHAGGLGTYLTPEGVVELMVTVSRLDLPLGVEGVISLPPATFAPAGTTAKTSVTFLRKAPAESRKHVFLARADHVGFVMSKGSPACDPGGDDLPGIAEDIRRFIAHPDSWQPSKRMATRRYADLGSLDASTLDENAEAARGELKDAGGLEARTILQFNGKRRSPVAGGLPFVSVLHVDKLGAVDWDLAWTHRPVTPGQLAEPGELLVSLLNPGKFRAAVVPSRVGQVQCSAEFGVFRPDLDPYTALVLLQHPLVRRQIAPLGRGTSSSRRRIDAEDVLSLMLPPFDDSWASRAGEAARGHLEHIASARRGLRNLYL